MSNNHPPSFGDEPCDSLISVPESKSCLVSISGILRAEDALPVIEAAFPDIAIGFPPDCKWLVQEWSEPCWTIAWGRKDGEVRLPNRSPLGTIDEYRLFLAFTSLQLLDPEESQVFKPFLNGKRIHGKHTDLHLFTSLKDAITAVYLFSSALKSPC